MPEYVDFLARHFGHRRGISRSVGQIAVGDRLMGRSGCAEKRMRIRHTSSKSNMGGSKERYTSNGFLAQMTSFAEFGGRTDAPNAARYHFGSYDSAAI